MAAPSPYFIELPYTISNLRGWVRLGGFAADVLGDLAGFDANFTEEAGYGVVIATEVEAILRFRWHG